MEKAGLQENETSIHRIAELRTERNADCIMSQQGQHTRVLHNYEY